MSSTLDEGQEVGRRDFSLLSLQDLREECKSRNLPTSGLKNTLIQRLQQDEGQRMDQNEQVNDQRRVFAPLDEVEEKFTLNVQSFQGSEKLILHDELLRILPKFETPWEQDLDAEKRKECIQRWAWPVALPDKIPFTPEAWKSCTPNFISKLEKDVTVAQQALYETLAPMLGLAQWMVDRQVPFSEEWAPAFQDAMALLMNGLTKLTQIRRRMVLPKSKPSGLSSDLVKMVGSQDSVFAEDHLKAIRTQRAIRRDISSTQSSIKKNSQKRRNNSKKFSSSKRTRKFSPKKGTNEQ